MLISFTSGNLHFIPHERPAAVGEVKGKDYFSFTDKKGQKYRGYIGSVHNTCKMLA